MCVYSRVHIFLESIRFICMRFNEPWTAVPGQDEQLFSDWSVTCWWMGVGGQDVFPHERPITHLSPLVLELTSLILLSLPPL